MLGHLGMISIINHGSRVRENSEVARLLRYTYCVKQYTIVIVEANPIASDHKDGLVWIVNPISHGVQHVSTDPKDLRHCRIIILQTLWIQPYLLRKYLRYDLGG